MKIFCKILCYFKILFYFCTVKTKLLGYGVMVTLQILVLSFLVRIQVAQHNDSHSRVVFLYSHGLTNKPPIIKVAV